MSKRKRNYSFKDAVMLMAAKTILQSMLANLDTLGMVRTNWTEAYVTGLIQKIDDALENYLGLDKNQPLRNATAALLNIQAPALRDLAMIKVQIEVDFKNDAAEIKKSLGINKKINETDQESLIEMLYAFKKGMDQNMKADITEKGTNPVLIDNIIGYASALQEANVEQEGLKSTVKEVSKEALDVFNAIYDEVIGISKIASKFFKDDHLKKEQFTFRKVANKMGTPKE